MSERNDPGPGSLIRVNKYGEADAKGSRLMDPTAAQAFRALRAAAAKDGLDSELLTLISAYRSQRKQDSLQPGAIAKHGDASRSFTANRSEHITGRAVDVRLSLELDPRGNVDSRNIGALKQTAAYDWMHANAGRFGFNEFLPVGRSPGEPWHYSYNVR